jgi:hypothetical protein
MSAMLSAGRGCSRYEALHSHPIRRTEIFLLYEKGISEGLRAGLGDGTESMNVHQGLCLDANVKLSKGNECKRRRGFKAPLPAHKRRVQRTLV